MADLDERQRPTLRSLAWVVARNANWTIGGGVATIEMLRRGMVHRGWLNDSEHQQLFAAARVTPGTNLLAYCTAAGWHVRRTLGAIVALLAASVPCTVIAVVVTILYDRLEASPTFTVVVTLGMTVALAMLAVGAWQLARPQLNRAKAVRSGVILTLVAICYGAGVSPVWTLAAAAAVGVLWPATPQLAS
jgi:chromate transporter